MDKSDIILKKDLIKAIFSPKNRKKDRSRKVNAAFDEPNNHPGKESQADAR